MASDYDSSRKSTLTTDVNKFYSRRNFSTKIWSALYHGFLYLSAILSAAAAVILKLDLLKDNGYQNDISAILAAIAAIVTTLTAAGSFHRKWRVNRTSRSKLEFLKIELSDPDADGDKIREDLKKLIREHDEGIIGPDR